jgi:multicomponent Na+:H+ antiporter subunit C
MNTTEWFGIAAALLIGLGLFGILTQPMILRKIVSFNVLGSGVFLLFGVVARRGAAAELGGDPVPHAFVITGIVVAFSASALAVTMALKLHEDTGESAFPESEETGQSGEADKEEET